MKPTGSERALKATQHGAASSNVNKGMVDICTGVVTHLILPG